MISELSRELLLSEAVQTMQQDTADGDRVGLVLNATENDLIRWALGRLVVGSTFARMARDQMRSIELVEVVA